MHAPRLGSFDQTDNGLACSEYFYDMLHQLLLIGRHAGGQTATDALLIGGLLASRQHDSAVAAPTEMRAAS